jgi:hypothetical protein
MDVHRDLEITPQLTQLLAAFVYEIQRLAWR